MPMLREHPTRYIPDFPGDISFHTEIQVCVSVCSDMRVVTRTDGRMDDAKTITSDTAHTWSVKIY